MTGQIIEDEQIELVELCEDSLELQFAARGLKLLDQIGRSADEDAPPVLDQCEAGSRCEMALPPPGGPNISTLAPLVCQLSPAAIAMT